LLFYANLDALGVKGVPMRALIRLSFLYSLLLLPIAAALATTPTKLSFRQPEAGPIPAYITTLLEEAYAQLGIKLVYLEMPRARSIVEANAGRIAGELGRIPGLDQDYPNLIAVDFTLFQYQLVVVADRRQCGLCELQDIKNLAYINGMTSVEQVLAQQNYQGPTVQAVDLAQLHLMYANRRVKAIALNDFEARELGLVDDPHNIVVPILTEVGYHYLHKQHAHLIPKLTDILHKMHNSGRVAEIMRDTGASISNPSKFTQPPQFGRLSVAAGHWRNYTNIDGSGTYWELLRRIFDPVTNALQLNANTLQRATAGLEEQRFDIVIGNYADHALNNAIASRLHFDYDRPLYLFAHDHDALNAIVQGDFEPLICQVAGYGYERFLANSLKHYYTNTTRDCFTLLNLDRVGAVISYYENTPDWLDTSYQYIKLHDSLPIHAIFQDTPRGLQLRDWFDRRLAELVRSGEIAEFYGEDDLKRSTYYQNIQPNQLQQSAVDATPQN
jgi:ABC-type amino acid transport substrate-binding protein